MLLMLEGSKKMEKKALLAVAPWRLKKWEKTTFGNTFTFPPIFLVKTVGQVIPPIHAMDYYTAGACSIS